eukprot:TRINITY_DN1237_c0_g1_i14.p1 TRINITY_DN1237_c0_g1~~TRINITY_DN1237_c0_g1_i14.p1  ORF type:complete len:153 (-),score=55.13 TRINITY_DN1237_c0_g1_i14:104-562(-)
MGFKKFVEAGRVAYINYGEDYGKICVVVEVINGSKVLVDGPTLGVKRQPISLRRLIMTEFHVPVSKGVKTHHLEEEIKKYKLADKWSETKLAKKLATHEKRSKLNDFERFQVMVYKRQRAYMVNKAMAQAKVKGKAPKGKPAKGKKCCLACY